MGLFGSIRRWRARHLAMSWGVYWLGLFAFTLGPAVLTAWRITRTSGSAISLSFANGVMNLLMTHLGRTVYTSSATLMEVTAWVAVPPLLLTGVWLALRPRRSTEAVEPHAAQLGSGIPSGLGDQGWKARPDADKSEIADR